MVDYPNPHSADGRPGDSEPRPPESIDFSTGAVRAFAKASDSVLKFRPGDLIAGQFSVVRALGRGGMGVIYEVVDNITGQRLALKTIRPSLLARPGVLQCFVREVTLARRLRHPGIVAVFDVRQDGPLLFFTMEYVEGDTLREMLRRHKTFPERQAAAIARELCLALEHAHRLMVHRDLSPENVMVTKTGVKLLDFGIAKALGGAELHGRAVGKGNYTAPEQREDSSAVDARADLYSLGMIFFEMLSGDTLEGIDRVADRCEGLTPECRAVIERSIAPLERRFGSAREFRIALKRCAGSRAPQAARPDSVTVPSAVAVRRVPEAMEGAPSAPSRGTSSVRWLATLMLVAVAVLAPLLLLYVIPNWDGLVSRRTPEPGPSIEAPQPAPVEPSPSPRRLHSRATWEEKGRTASLRLPGGETMEFARIRTGIFTMGYDSGRMDDTAPVRQVRITRRFWIGACEVTQAQWETVMKTRPWARQPNASTRPEAPAVYVSWYAAQEFIQRLNLMGVGRFRLPTEAQWEFACRAGTGTQFYYGRDPEHAELAEYAWFYGNTKGARAARAHAVGAKQPNNWGLCDVLGNVSEWCSDWYDASYYQEGPTSDPRGPSSGASKVVRGGSWRDFAKDCTCHRRSKEAPNVARSTIGFRICRDFDDDG